MKGGRGLAEEKLLGGLEEGSDSIGKNGSFAEGESCSAKLDWVGKGSASKGFVGKASNESKSSRELSSDGFEADAEAEAEAEICSLIGAKGTMTSSASSTEFLSEAGPK